MLLINQLAFCIIYFYKTAILHMKTLFAFYSPKQAARCGTVIYQGIDGGEVECTEVSDTNPSRSTWDDSEYLKEVVHYSDGGYIRKGVVVKAYEEEWKNIIGVCWEDLLK